MPEVSHIFGFSMKQEVKLSEVFVLFSSIPIHRVEFKCFTCSTIVGNDIPASPLH